MATRERGRAWLERQALKPGGRAWGAVLLADYDALAKTLERYGKQATEAVQGGFGHPVTALTAGAVRGDTRAVTMLLDADADPNEKASGHQTASTTAWAIEADSLGCVLLLLAAQQHAGINQPEDEDWSNMAVLHHDYTVHPDPDILRALLANGARATQRALCASISEGVQQAAELLLDHGCDANRRDEQDRETPLGWCVQALGAKLEAPATRRHQDRRCWRCCSAGEPIRMHLAGRPGCTSDRCSWRRPKPARHGRSSS